MLPRLALTFALAILVCPAALHAQPPQLPPPSQPESPELANDGVAPAHVSHVDGAASLEREGRAENSPLNMPILSGDRLRTADGRLEVLFADGSTLHLDLRSTIDVQSDDLVRLTEGRLRLNILGPAPIAPYRIDSPAGSARITQPGEYRLALLRGTDEVQLEVAVLRGAAEVFTDQGTTPVRAGERANASAGLAPSYAYAYNSATSDPFDRWSEARRNERLGVSSQYLPDDMQAYAPLLDESGDWRYTESYGYAWYPRVAEEWRPYYNGRWATYPRYGWTWIGADRFAWPTHHYGRWGFSAGAWFWTPSSRWAPAYVSWGYAPGYVSWCPLGFDNQPIFGLNISRSGPGHYSSWRGWTAVSSSSFGGRDHWVNQRAVNWDRHAGPRPHFETRPSAPGFARDVAVPRNSTPIRWAGSRHGSPSGAGRDRGRDDARRAVSSARDSLSPARNGASAPRSGASTARDSASPARDAAAAPRDAASVRRDPAMSSRDGGDAAAPPAGRTSATPRYVNRGDEIVRSRTERPTPRAGSTGTAIPRHDARTAPEAPTRSAQPAPERDAPSFERPAAQDRARTPGAGGVQSPSYQPSYRPVAPSTVSGAPRTQPRGDASGASESPRTESRGDGGQDRARAYEQSRPGREAQPAPSRVEVPTASRVETAAPRQPAPERAAPVERAPSRADSPNRGDSGQPPPQRSAPSSGGAGQGSAPRAGGGTASSSTGAAAPRRGRGGL